MKLLKRLRKEFVTMPYETASKYPTKPTGYASIIASKSEHKPSQSKPIL